MDKNPKQIIRTTKGWHVLEILNGKEVKKVVKKNPILKPFTRQGGLVKKAKQGT